MLRVLPLVMRLLELLHVLLLLERGRVLLLLPVVVVLHGEPGVGRTALGPPSPRRAIAWSSPTTPDSSRRSSTSD